MATASATTDSRRLTLWTAGIALFAAALACTHGGQPLAAAAGTGLGLWLIGRAGGAHDGHWAALRHAAVAACLALAADPELRPWQTPAQWGDLLRLTPLGATLALAVYGAAAGLLPLRQHRPLPAATATALLLTPFVVFNGLFVLAAPALLDDLGARLGGWLPAVLQRPLASWLVLGLCGEWLIQGLGLAMDQRWTRAPRLHRLLWAVAALAVASPHCADWGSGAWLADQPLALRLPLLILAAALAQAGLWGQTFLLTGALLDVLQGRRPTHEALFDHWRSGTLKGAVYSAWFVAIIQGGALLGSGLSGGWITAQPLLAGIALGAALFPLGRAIVETFDGSPPLHGRLVAAYQMPANLLHGAAAGCAVALWLQLDLIALDPSARFGRGFLAGALVYAGVTLLRDLAAVGRGRRRRPQRLSVYGLMVLMGGITGGLLAWYFDPAQLAVVLGRFGEFAAVHYPASGRGSLDYIVYPLFSKWGATDLGAVAGGVKLFYAQSLSGVLQWSLAAPLFSLNLVLLTALIQRRLAPIRATFSRAGLAEVGAQTVRVLRWGLWMAPIIGTFLRMAPDPAWYNQDGAVRSLLATTQELLRPDADFRAWSLELFLGLMAYDWLRVLIWFDHMGLRVATLVNFSFVGMDAVDARLARALGQGPRGQAIPEGLRRFATWAPLLVPFYIPRGGEWDAVWSGAERMQQQTVPLLPAVGDLLGAYAAAAVVALAVATWVLARGWRRGNLHPIRQAQVHLLGNGRYQLLLGADGRGHARALRATRGCPEIDLTRRPDSDLDRCGRFFYVSEAGRAPRALTLEPCRDTAGRHRLVATTTTALGYRADWDDLHAQLRVEIPAAAALEHWTLRLENRTTERRALRIASFQELTLGSADAAARHPQFNALHVATCFVAPLGALLARSRLLTGGDGRPGTETAFHAAASDGQRVRLVGYEDSRGRFLGAGGVAAPDGLAPAAARKVADQGLLHSFDPAFSLTLAVDLPPGGSATLHFVTGFAPDSNAAAALIARHLGTPLPPASVIAGAFATPREVRDAEPPASAFSADGWRLDLDGTAARPYSHLIANALGHGAVLDSTGQIFAFAGNSQQNALSPELWNAANRRLPGEAIYVVDLDSGTCASPCFAPWRRHGVAHRAEFRPGAARFTGDLDGLELELELCVPPDVPVQLRLLRIRNRGASERRCRVVAYLEWVLAQLPADSRGLLEIQQGDGLVLARNPGNGFAPGWAFLASNLDAPTVETLRSRFIGRAAQALPCFVSRGHGDPAATDDGSRCAALAGEIAIAPGGEYQLSLVLGQAATVAEARTLAAHYRAPQAARAAVAATDADWQRRLGQVRITTTAPAFDHLLNIWLPYQVIAARLWARCGPEQRSGAYGFRDQLQDVLPLLLLDPALARQQILRHARQQFVEGDVLHWWHPTPGDGTGFGARTRASDPQAWLPYLTAQYVAATGDAGILDERTPFLEGLPIPHHAEGLGQAPRPGAEAATLYEHCRRAIDYTLARRGRHGLPLIGSGDWNDALDRIGHRGRGESLWLGLFLHRVLLDFLPVAQARDDAASVARWQQAATALRTAIARQRDGARFARAIDDAGAALFQTNALTAAWPALSGAVTDAESLAALRADLPELEAATLVRAQWPPFDVRAKPWPGRIALYPPGVRENGGQYSHGASWLVDALVALARDCDDPATAHELGATAWRLWHKISPLGHAAPEQAARYGLAPHQQAADIYSGPGYEGRGGWSWYTGAAARMLHAAHLLLGIEQRDGEVRVQPLSGVEPQLRELRVRGEVIDDH